VESKAKLFGHPVHQMMVVFPLGLLATSVGFDLAAAATKNKKLDEQATAMLGVGIVGALAAAPFGLIDWLAIPKGTRAKEIGRLHGLGNLVVAGLFGASWLLRRGRSETETSGIVPVALSVCGASVSMLTAWLGGELVDRLGIGVDDGAHPNAPSSLTGQPTSESISETSENDPRADGTQDNQAIDNRILERSKTMAEHTASVVVKAPVNQVYQLFSHFNDFPKFMSAIKEVTYHDNERSHWVANIVGAHEWDAVNENWIENKQIGWRSTDGLENSGIVRFEADGASQTRITVKINYNPPAGLLGDVGEKLGAGKHFETQLQKDLDNFAKMVDEAPAGALDPTSSAYLFHDDSAAAKGKTTKAQNATMDDEMMDEDEAKDTAQASR
jgi:uncharacterized membrane protein